MVRSCGQNEHMAMIIVKHFFIGPVCGGGCAVRLPTSLAGMTGTEFGRITFVFETICSADCELYFMMVCVGPFASARVCV